MFVAADRANTSAGHLSYGGVNTGRLALQRQASRAFYLALGALCVALFALYRTSSTDPAHSASLVQELRDELKLLSGDVFALEQDAYRRAGRGRLREAPGSQAIDSIASLRAAGQTITTVLNAGANEETAKTAIVRAHRSAERAAARLRAAARAPTSPPEAQAAWLALDAFANSIARCRAHLAAHDVEKLFSCVASAAACVDEATGGATALLIGRPSASHTVPDETCLADAKYTADSAKAIKESVDSSEASAAVKEAEAAEAAASKVHIAHPEGVPLTGERGATAYLADLARIANRLEAELSDGVGSTNAQAFQTILLQAHRRSERYAREHAADMSTPPTASENEAQARLQRVVEALSRARATWVSQGDSSDLRRAVAGVVTVASASS